MLNYQTIIDISTWDTLKDEWNRLLEKSITHVPFLRQEFLRDWWNTLGGGEWKNGELVIVTAREEGELIGIAPLFLTQKPHGMRSLMFLGSFEIVDFLDFLVKPEDIDRFLEGLFEYLSTGHVPAWDEVDLYNILNHSPSLAALERIATGAGWKCKSELLQKSPYIPLKGDWETYLSGIDKKQRHEIRRKMRRAEESGYQTQMVITTEKADLEQDIQDFLGLMVQDPEKEKFLSEKMREQLSNMIRCAFENGCLHLAFLEIGGERASAYLSFDYLNKLWVYNSGINRQLNEYSPGWVLLGFLLKWANEHGYSEFDFMRGDEEYKYRFGAIDRFVYRVTLTK